MFGKVSKTLTPKERSEKLTKTFTDAIEELNSINEDINLSQHQITEEIKNLQKEHGELEDVRIKNMKFSERLKSLFE